MPDIWTKHPEIVRDLLKEAGFKCGVEPRILKGRDPNWTCVVDGKSMWGDLYIHNVEEILKTPAQEKKTQGLGIFDSIDFIALAILLAVIFGQAWVIRKLKRQTTPV